MAIAVVAVLVIGGLVPVQSADSQAPDGRELFRFQDPRIAESSGLAVVDGLVVTVNDSGYTPRVYAVDPATGRTVGETVWTGPLRDAEALAPGGRGAVWVGDIGDNEAVRDFVRVVRLPIGRGSRTVSVDHHELRYPDGPQDAETLLVHPGDGRVIVVTKSIFGGVAYAAPPLTPGTRLTMRRAASGLMRGATDGAFFPDGRHVILRDYGSAVVYRHPSWEEVGRFRLPEQPQGEGIAVDADGRILISTEGVGSAVLEVALPGGIRRAVAGRPEPSTTTATTSTTPASGVSEEDRSDEATWIWILVGGSTVVVLAAAAVIRRRR